MFKGSQKYPNIDHPVTSRPSPFRFAMLDASEASEGTPTTLDARSAGPGHDQQTLESGAKPKLPGNHLLHPPDPPDQNAPAFV